MTQDNAIRDALSVIGERHPELGALIALVRDRLEITRAFVAAYDASPASYGKKSLVLRALLADPSACVSVPHGHATDAVMRRMADWILLRSSEAHDPIPSEHPPKFISGALGVRRSMDAVVRTGFVVPWAAGLIPFDDRRADVVRRRALTLARAEQIIQGRSSPTGDWYFRTGSGLLDLANSLIYLGALFECDRDGGRIQNLVPAVLTDRWGLRRLSVPATLLWCDTVTLMLDGVIPETRDCELAEAIKGLDHFRSLSPAHGAALDVALDRHRDRWRLNPERAERYRAMREEGQRGGTYDTSLFFNLPHLLSSADPAISAFADHYSRINAAVWVERERTSWSEISPDIARTVLAALDAGVVPPLQARGIGNILALLHASRATTDDDAWRELPPVARDALGSPLPRPSKNAKPRGLLGGGVSSSAGRRGTLPLLATLQGSSRPAAMLVSPAYRGHLDPSLSWFTPAALAAGRTLPVGVSPVGDVPLAWGACALENARQHLERSGFKVTLVADSGPP